MPFTLTSALGLKSGKLRVNGLNVTTARLSSVGNT